MHEISNAHAKCNEMFKAFKIARKVKLKTLDYPLDLSRKQVPRLLNNITSDRKWGYGLKTPRIEAIVVNEEVPMMLLFE